MSVLKRREAEKAAAPTSTLQHEDTHHTTYDAEALAAKTAKDLYAMMPWVDRDHDIHATNDHQDEEQKAKEAKQAEEKKAEEKKLKEKVDDAKSMAIAAQLVACSSSMNRSTSRQFLHALDSIDSKYVRDQVRGLFAEQTGQSIDVFIRDCTDWNNNGDKRDRDAARSLMSDERMAAQEELAKLTPVERETMKKEADKRAIAILAAKSLHDMSDENEGKILKELAGCNAAEVEMLRKSLRETSRGEENLYQVLDDGMSGKNQNNAIAMLDGNRVHSAQLELEKVKDTALFRQRIAGMSGVELAALRNNPMTHAVILQLDNPADREEMRAAISGNKAKANAIKLGNALEFKEVTGIVQSNDKTKSTNNDRRSAAEVMKLFEGMPAEEVKAAVAEWNKMYPLRPMESMLEARWGDDDDQTEHRRLKAKMKGDEAANRAIRAAQAMREDDQEMLEAALATASPQERDKLQTAMVEEDRYQDRNALIMHGQDEKEAVGRSARTQLNDYYEKQREKKSKQTAQWARFGLDDDTKKAIEESKQKAKEEIDDKHHATLDLLDTGKVSVATDMHRAKDDKAKLDILQRCKTDKELEEAMKLYEERHKASMLPYPGETRLEMNMTELKIDNIRRYGPVSTRPAELQATLDLEIMLLQQSDSLERDEADRAGGGTQRLVRQQVGREFDMQKDPKYRIAHPELRANPLDVTGTLHIDRSGGHLPTREEIERDLPLRKLTDKDGLKEGVTKEDFIGVTEAKAVADDTQVDAKKRLAERKVARLATIAQIAGALTGSVLISAAIMLGEAGIGMLIKNEVMGRDYDPKEDLKALTIKLLAEAAGAAAKGKFGALAGGLTKVGVNEGIGGAMQGKSLKEILLGLAMGAAGATIPDALKKQITAAITSGSETLMKKALGEAVGHLGEAAASTAIGVAGGSDLGDAAKGAAISMGGGLGQKAWKHGKHDPLPTHHHPSATKPDASHNEQRSAPASMQTHDNPSVVPPHPSMMPPHDHRSATSPHPLQSELHAHPPLPQQHPLEAHPTVAHRDVVANGHHAETAHVEPARMPDEGLDVHTRTTDKMPVVNPPTGASSSPAQEAHQHFVDAAPSLQNRIDRATGVDRGDVNKRRQEWAAMYARQEREAQHVVHVENQIIEPRRDGSHYVANQNYDVRRFHYDNGVLTHIGIDLHMAPGAGVTKQDLAEAKGSTFKGTDAIVNTNHEGDRHTLPDGSKLHVEPVFHDDPANAKHHIELHQPDTDPNTGFPIEGTSNQTVWKTNDLRNPAVGAHEAVGHPLGLPDRYVDPMTYGRATPQSPGVSHDGNFMQTVDPIAGPHVNREQLDQVGSDIARAESGAPRGGLQTVPHGSPPCCTPAPMPPVVRKASARRQQSVEHHVDHEDFTTEQHLSDHNDRTRERSRVELDAENAPDLLHGEREQRPTPRETEDDTNARPLGGEVPREQVSFLHGKEVPYGTKYSVRPEGFVVGATAEAKNYGDLHLQEQQKKLVNNIARQAKQRDRHLPPGTEQMLTIDVRGQNISADVMMRMRIEISGATGGGISPDQVTFLTDDGDNAVQPVNDPMDRQGNFRDGRS